jgi:zinc transport system substrate-binding protein
MRYIISLALASTLSLPAAAEVPLVVTDIPPVGSLVAQVMGDLGSPVVLLDKGADAHAFQLRPSQAADLQKAGLIVWIGPEMTPWLDRALSGLGDGTPEVRLLAEPGTMRQGFANHDAHDDHDAEKAEAGHADHDAAEHVEGDHAGHAHSGTDPHAWLDPANAGVWLGVIAARLSELDPGNAATYAANAARARTDLAALDAEVKAMLAPAAATPIVVFHNAYGYFAGHYGLTVAGAISDGDAAAPGAAHLKELQADLAATPVCLFPEANHDPKLVAAIAEGTGAKVGAALDPEGSALPNGPNLYGDMMRSMAATIAGCAAG